MSPSVFCSELVSINRSIAMKNSLCFIASLISISVVRALPIHSTIHHLQTRAQSLDSVDTPSGDPHPGPHILAPPIVPPQNRGGERRREVPKPPTIEIPQNIEIPPNGHNVRKHMWRTKPDRTAETLPALHEKGDQTNNDRSYKPYPGRAS